MKDHRPKQIENTNTLYRHLSVMNSSLEPGSGPFKTKQKHKEIHAILKHAR